MIDIGLSFATGIIVTLLGVWLTQYYQHQHEKNKKKEKIRFEIYMYLIDLNSSYFWLTTAESHGEKPDAEILRLLRNLTHKISDKLRQEDSIEYLEDILDVLFNERFKSAVDRSKKLNELIDNMSAVVSPRFMRKMKSVSNENLKIRLTRNVESFNAPGTFRL